MNQLSFDFKILDVDTDRATLGDCTILTGLKLEGASIRNCQLEELEVGYVNHCALPDIAIRPMLSKDIKQNLLSYSCPLYRTAERRGTYSSTGHNTNYIMDIQLPIRKMDIWQHWAKRGVALLCELED